jgi:hypothetical protein
MSMGLDTLPHRMEATPRFELGMKDLQSSALPLGYVAIFIEKSRPNC